LPDILVVGGGPVGLTLAIELRRRGISVRLIDSAEGPFGGSRGKGIQPRSLEILDMMGAIDDVLADSSLYQLMKLHIGPLRIKAKSLGTSHAATTDRPYPNMVMVAQWRTELALRRRLEELGGAVEYGVGLETLTQSSGEVTARLTNGEQVTAAYLVGCDGGRSPTRKQLGLQLIGSAIDDRTMIVADMEIDGLDRRYWHVWPRRYGGPVAFAPLPNSNLWQLQASEKIADAGLENGVYRLTGKRPGKVVWQSRFRHQARMVERYRVGRVFLAGDAAHIHPPSGAQGLNTGIQDAFNLGWKLVSALRTGDGGILDTYEAERLPIAAEMLNLTSKLLADGSNKRGELTNQLGVGYRSSPLSKGGAIGNLFPGDRMPDERLADGRRLLEVLRTGNAVQILRQDGRKILVRPDGYVAEVIVPDVTSYFGFDVEHVSPEYSN